MAIPDIFDVAEGALPVYFFAESSCSRVLIVSIGCRKHASMVPPIDPAGMAVLA